MTVKEKLIEYCVEHSISKKEISSLIGISKFYLIGDRLNLITQLKILFRCWKYIGNTEEFKREVAIGIRKKLWRIDYIDSDKISDDDCLKIFNILKKYYKG